MRKISLLIFAILSFSLSQAQYTVVSDDSSYVPTSANALLEIHSASGNKGILVPRLTTAQRTALVTVTPADNSLLVYDTDTKTFWYFDGTAWVEIVPGGTDDQYLTLSNDTLYIENGNSIYLGGYNQTLTFDDVTNQLTISNGNTVIIPDSVNDADSDPTNEIELPATAVTGQVLTWDGSAWVAQNPGAGADNWGSQVVVSDATLTGDGTSGNPLSVNGDLTDDQDLSLSGNNLNITDGTGVDLSTFMDNTDDQNLTGATLTGTTLQINIENGNSASVDLASLQDGTGTDDQNISGSGLSGTTLTIGIENGNSETVDLSSLGNDWKLTGNAGTTVGTNFLGTTDNVSLSFKTNNAERMRILNTGNVGIGTTSPTSLLQVNGGTRILYSTSPTLYLENNANSASNYALQVQSQGGTRAWIASNGRAYFADRVGVGTASPTDKLHVYGATGNIIVSNTDESDAGLILNDAQATTSQYAEITYGSGDNDLNFLNASTTPRMVIESSGEVGIGTDSPAETLHVNGSFRLTNGTQAAGRILTSDANGTATWQTPNTYGTNNQGVSGTTDITLNTNTFTDMSQMSITFTPVHSIVYVYFTFSAYADPSAYPMEYVDFRILRNGVNVGGSNCLVEDYDDGSLVTSFNGAISLAVSVTPGTSTVIKVQWRRDGLYTSEIYCNPGSAPDYAHRSLIIID